MGLAKGWGDTAERVAEMVHLLLDILQAPDPSTLEMFLGRIPMVFNVVILSPHGYFGQANVLGLPDTGGQVMDPVFPYTYQFRSHCLFQYEKLWVSGFHTIFIKVVYILDQVRALEHEMLLRIQRQGLDIIPRVLVVS